MQTCENCGSEFEDGLDRCPHCAEQKLENELHREVTVFQWGLIALAAIAVLFILAIGYYSWAMHRTPAVSATAKTTAVTIIRSASTSPSGQWRPVNAQVIVTVNIPTGQLGGTAKSRSVGQGVARLILGTYPSVASVAVFDGSRVLIGQFRR